MGVGEIFDRRSSILVANLPVWQVFYYNSTLGLEVGSRESLGPHDKKKTQFSESPKHNIFYALYWGFRSTHEEYLSSWLLAIPANTFVDYDM